ncbi:DUF6518 family protein [Intrasporangium sp.]|uniref:DUF6518 family protein n=1 Tax=Intrasporangium sp. TaxID=1925024 RepID=UPI00336534FB
MDSNAAIGADLPGKPTTGASRVNWAPALVAGIALGVANSLSNALGSAYGPFTATPGQGVRWLEYLSSWLGTPWAWALFAFGVGWFSRRLRAATLTATAGLLLAVLAYYLSDAILGLNEQLSLIEIQFWSLISLFVGPVMAALGALARRPRAWSLLPGLGAPAVMVYFGLTRPSGNPLIQPWAQWAVLVAAALLTLALLARTVRLQLSPRRPG